ncbi:hypothetical protein [Formosa sp. A9]|uniref:hypothetical protein n=1 Tax=Formosa sp. A9 TaxID=3442641 RepID=UPI003EB84D4F
MKPKYIEMRKMHFLLFFIVASIICSCQNDDDVTDEVNYSIIGEGELYGNGQEEIEPSALIIKDSSTWIELTTKMDSYHKVTNTFNDDIDFESETVLAIFDSIRARTHYAVTITTIQETSNKVIVNYKKTSTSEGYDVINQPFIIIKIPKSDNKDIMIKK